MNYFEDFDDFENPKNRSDDTAERIIWLQKAIEQLEKRIENAPADIDEYLIESNKKALEELKKRLQNLSNGKDEFTGKKDPDDYGPNDNLMELFSDDYGDNSSTNLMEGYDDDDNSNTNLMEDDDDEYEFSSSDNLMAPDFFEDISDNNLSNGNKKL